MGFADLLPDVGCRKLFSVIMELFFVGGENELKRAMQGLQSDRVQHFTAKNGIDWRFIPPCAPHMGWAWERLI